METLSSSYETEQLRHLEATELRLGLPGSDGPCSGERNKKRAAPEKETVQVGAPPAKAQVVGWPPVRSHRKNYFRAKKSEGEGLYVKVSMDGAPYLRKIDINIYNGYQDLLLALETMFKCAIGGYSEKEGYNIGKSDYAPTYEDKDGDWMLVGDVPWDMFVTSCKRLRIMKGSEAKGLRCL